MNERDKHESVSQNQCGISICNAIVSVDKTTLFLIRTPREYTTFLNRMILCGHRVAILDIPISGDSKNGCQPDSKNLDFTDGD